MLCCHADDALIIDAIDYFALRLMSFS